MKTAQFIYHSFSSKTLAYVSSDNASYLITFSSCAARAKVAITATKVVVGDKKLPLKANVDKALTELDKDNANTVKHVLVAMGDDVDDISADSGNDIHLEKV